MSRIVMMTVLLAACRGAESTTASRSNSTAPVDSIFPMPVMIERFQIQAGPPLDALRGGARSRDSLVMQFVRAVEDSSAQALRELRLNMREYAYLYAPTSRMTAEPYRQPPALGWVLV